MHISAGVQDSKAIPEHQLMLAHTLPLPPGTGQQGQQGVGGPQEQRASADGSGAGVGVAARQNLTASERPTVR